MTTKPCPHAHGAILVCSSCFTGQVAYQEELRAAISPLEGTENVLEGVKKAAVSRGVSRSRRPFEGLARKRGRPRKVSPKPFAKSTTLPVGVKL